MGSIPYVFKCLNIDTYELSFLVRIESKIMQKAFKESVKKHAKKTGVDLSVDIGDSRVNSFSADPKMKNLVGTGMGTFWKNATNNVFSNSGHKVKCVSKRVKDVLYERQSDGSWACRVIFVGEYIDGR